MACDLDSHHFLFLQRKEAKGRRKEVVVPPLTSVTEVCRVQKGLLSGDLVVNMKSETHRRGFHRRIQASFTGPRPQHSERHLFLFFLQDLTIFLIFLLAYIVE